VTKYQKRISGPLLDRIDIHVEVPRVDYQKLSDDRLGEASDVIRQRVEAAREKQRGRFATEQPVARPDGHDGAGSEAHPQRGTRVSKFDALNVICNADMRVGEIRQFCKLEAAGESLVRAAMGQMNLSARGYHRVLKLSRTIADLAGSESIQAQHIAEALQYRPRGM
jgi:magnesium chelatase family protein